VAQVRVAFFEENVFRVARELLAVVGMGHPVSNNAEIERDTGMSTRTIRRIRNRVRDANLGVLPAEATMVMGRADLMSKSRGGLLCSFLCWFSDSFISFWPSFGTDVAGRVRTLRTLPI
jgi:hypothetical protein